MRISELARRSEVPVATIKFYLREGLLHDGVLTSATQAQYGEDHVDRLRLVRALIGPGGLSLADVRRVLATIDDPPPAIHSMLGVAAAAVSTPREEIDHTRVHALLTELGWPTGTEHCRSHNDLARALAALDDAGLVLPEGMLGVYADHVTAIARAEIEEVPTDSAAAAVRYVVLGTVLVEPVLLAMRRMAHAELSAQRFGAGTP